MDALTAFENTVRQHPTRGLMPDIFLRKLESFDASNPEYLDRLVDHDWQVFRAGWMAATSAKGAGELLEDNATDAPANP